MIAARHIASLALVAAVTFLARPAAACSSCGCGDVTLTATGVERPYRNRIRLALEERYGNFTQGDPVGGERVDFLRTSLAFSWSPHKRVTVAALLPWLTSWVQPFGGRRTLVNGLGDLELSVRGVVYAERGFAPHHLVWLGGGLKMPTGYRAYDSTGFPISDDDQPGSGSWDPFAGVTYAWFSEHLLSFFASTSGRFTTRGWHGYRRGSTVNGSMALQVQPRSWLAVQAGIDWTWEAHDTLGNGAELPNTGGFVGYAMLGLMSNPWRDLLLRVAIDAPAITRLNGEQSSGPQAVLQISYDFL